MFLSACTTFHRSFRRYEIDTYNKNVLRLCPMDFCRANIGVIPVEAEEDNLHAKHTRPRATKTYPLSERAG